MTLFSEFSELCERTMHINNYAQDHSVLIFNCTTNIMFTVLCQANVTAYINKPTCFI